jgi:hypothetical protein
MAICVESAPLCLDDGLMMSGYVLRIYPIRSTVIFPFVGGLCDAYFQFTLILLI